MGNSSVFAELWEVEDFDEVAHWPWDIDRSVPRFYYSFGDLTTTYKGFSKRPLSLDLVPRLWRTHHALLLTPTKLGHHLSHPSLLGFPSSWIRSRRIFDALFDGINSFVTWSLVWSLLAMSSSSPPHQSMGNLCHSNLDHPIIYSHSLHLHFTILFPSTFSSVPLASHLDLWSSLYYLQQKSGLSQQPLPITIHYHTRGP